MNIKMEFAERLKLSIKNAGLSGKSNVELGKMFGVSGPMISNYTKGKKMPAVDQGIHIANVLNADFQWLMTGKNSTKVDINKKNSFDLYPISDNIKEFPLIEWDEVKTWSHSSMSKETKHKEFKQTTLDVSDFCFWLEVISDNMNPDFTKGDRILIDPKMTPRNNDFILILIGLAS